MSQHRDGKKFRGTHTTCTDLAGVVADIAEQLGDVTGISLGVIQSGAGVAGGTRKVLFADGMGSLLLTVRQSRSVQEVRIFAPNIQTTRTALARALRNEDIPIAFRKKN